MKVYIIDKNKKNLNIIKSIPEADVKDTYKYKATKNDYTIIFDMPLKEEIADAKKLNNIIFITNKLDEKSIWELINEYKTVDIINAEMEEEYIIERCIKRINGN